ncbi:MULTISPECIES: hypothetical protein [Cryobacterium]|uniref:hypothetical protein n=1 Tax=Cryobacterium TaxID=69578 RepID=UPI00141ADF74|nr:MULTISPECIES: hypothetical protein [Cryobacterium]
MRVFAGELSGVRSSATVCSPLVTDAASRFGTVPGHKGSPLPAPQLPTVRLTPRG